MLRFTLDHADVIGSVPYGQGDGPPVPLHQLHHLSFLHRSDPAADDCFTQTGQVQQDVLQLWLQGMSLQRRTQTSHLLKLSFPPQMTSTPCGGDTKQQFNVTLPPRCSGPSHTAQTAAREQLLCEEMDLNENPVIEWRALRSTAALCSLRTQHSQQQLRKRKTQQESNTNNRTTK